MEKIRGRRHRATLQNYKATWTSLLTNEKAKSTFTRRLLRLNRHPTWALLRNIVTRKVYWWTPIVPIMSQVHVTWYQCCTIVTSKFSRPFNFYWNLYHDSPCYSSNCAHSYCEECLMVPVGLKLATSGSEVSTQIDRVYYSLNLNKPSLTSMPIHVLQYMFHVE